MAYEGGELSSFCYSWGASSSGTRASTKLNSPTFRPSAGISQG